MRAEQVHERERVAPINPTGNPPALPGSAEGENGDEEIVAPAMSTHAILPR